MTDTTIHIPTLQTERLTLRAPQASDAEAVAAFYASPRSSFVGGPLTAERAWRQLAGEAGHWVLRGYGRWVLEAEGAPVGIVGLWYPEGFPEHELGWDLFDGATGKGFATEAARAARAYAYDVLGWDTLISMVADGNDASAAVCARLGAQIDGTFDHAVFGRTTIWRHPAPAEVAP